MPSKDNNTIIECYENRRKKHSFSIENKVLKVKSKKIKWLDFSFRHAEVKLYLPRKKYDNLLIKVYDSNVEITDLTLNKNLTTNINTGNVKLKNISCNNLYTKTLTSRIEIVNLIASNVINIKSNTGKVLLEKSDGKDVYIKTNTGKIEVNLLSNKTYITRSNVGKVISDNHNINNTTITGKCEISTNTGNIILY